MGRHGTVPEQIHAERATRRRVFGHSDGRCQQVAADVGVGVSRLEREGHYGHT